MTPRATSAYEHRLTQRVTLTCEQDDAHRLGTWTVTSAGAEWKQLKHKGKPTTAQSSSGEVLLVCQKCRAVKPHAAIPFPERAAVEHLVEVMLVAGPAHVTVKATTHAVRAKARELTEREGFHNAERRIFSTDLNTRPDHGALS